MIKMRSKKIFLFELVIMAMFLLALSFGLAGFIIELAGETDSDEFPVLAWSFAFFGLLVYSLAQIPLIFYFRRHPENQFRLKFINQLVTYLCIIFCLLIFGITLYRTRELLFEILGI